MNTQVLKSYFSPKWAFKKTKHCSLRAVAGGKRRKKERITVLCEAEATRARQTLSTALLTLETCRSHRRYSVKVSKHMQYVWLWGPEELNAKQCWCFFTSSTCRNREKAHQKAGHGHSSPPPPCASETHGLALTRPCAPHCFKHAHSQVWPATLNYKETKSGFYFH